MEAGFYLVQTGVSHRDHQMAHMARFASNYPPFSCSMVCLNGCVPRCLKAGMLRFSQKKRSRRCVPLACLDWSIPDHQPYVLHALQSQSSGEGPGHSSFWSSPARGPYWGTEGHPKLLCFSASHGSQTRTLDLSEQLGQCNRSA